MKSFVSVMNIPAPYRIPLFEEFDRQLKERGISYHVDFMSRGHKDRPKSWLNPKMNVSHRYWRNLGPDQHEFNPLLVLKYIVNPPDYLDLGSPYDTFTCILLALFCRAKVKIMALEGNTKTPGKLDGFIGWFKRLIMKRATFLPVPGSDGRKFIALHQQRTRAKLGTSPYIPNVVDQSKFHPRAWWNPQQIAAVRSRLGVDEVTRMALIPARLEPVKGLLELVEQLDIDMLKGWKLIVLGQGPLKAELVCRIEAKGLSPFITILDYVDYAEMPRFYAAADLLLLPSVYDPNPLSVVESLFSGLPIALSCMAGNVEEGVTEGRGDNEKCKMKNEKCEGRGNNEKCKMKNEKCGGRENEKCEGNGWVLPVMEKDAYAEKLREVFSTPVERLREMGRWSVEHNARFWDLTSAVKNYLNAIVV